VKALPWLPKQKFLSFEREFFEIKMECMKLTKRFIELEEKLDAQSQNELKNIYSKFESLTIKLKDILNNNNCCFEEFSLN
jgi:hypothetical protein